ncbi:MAG: anhydro-N-acetylmuramic acid kinase [Alphaproteobacteria bacterium]|nr:MAG: anhydro-N-acetylmuramic acid kinase [Alphaproteobacteria bacterium]
MALSVSWCRCGPGCRSAGAYRTYPGPLAAGRRIYHNRPSFTNPPEPADDGRVVNEPLVHAIPGSGPFFCPVSDSSASRLRFALGLMSGTSLDGIDAALIRSDGRRRVVPVAALTVPYDPAFRARLRAILGGRGEVAAVERELTLRHVEAVEALLQAAGRTSRDVTVIGFHGHTILHAPEERCTWQIGDGALLAARIGIDVVADFRGRDVAAGGQGAPLAPLYHAALAADLDKPLAVLNLGGVGNVTWIGPGDGPGGDVGAALLAFDTGPGNALIDDWTARHVAQPFDRDGALARAGRVDEKALAMLLDHPYFDRSPPKALDRDAFDMAPLHGLSAADGAATLTAFTAAAVAAAGAHFPSPPRRWLVTGGGRRNPALMAALAARLKAPVAPVEAVGWDGDALEAQAFAYLALRSLDGLALTLPGTTGVTRPICGGILHRAS